MPALDAIVVRPRPAAAVPVGILLRRWRGLRRLSQLALANLAGVSARHLSFVETGRAGIGREVLLRLAEALDLPIRARNELLMAAGFAPAFRETGFAALPPDGVGSILGRIMAQQEPFPALVADRGWNILMFNAAASRMVRAFVPEAELRAAGAAARNAMKQIFHPGLLRPWVQDWPAVARQILLRLHHEAAEGGVGRPAAELLRELRGFPGAPELFDGGAGLPDNQAAMTVTLRRGDLALSYMSVLSTFGTPQDVTLQELRIKLFYPVDAASTAVFQRLAQG